MVTDGAGLVAASLDARLASTIANVFLRAGVVCEQSSDPIGVELAGVAKNAAALAAGATEAVGLNAAGAAAGHIFQEVWRYAERQGARPESMIGLAGTGDLVGTALAPQSRNRRAGELLAQGVPAAEIPDRIGQAVEALDVVPLLAEALDRAAIEAPVTDALCRLIAGELPLDSWVAQVRATVPPPARFGPRGAGRRAWEQARAWFRRRRRRGARAAFGGRCGRRPAFAVQLPLLRPHDLADGRERALMHGRAPARRVALHRWHSSGRADQEHWGRRGHGACRGRRGGWGGARQRLRYASMIAAEGRPAAAGRGTVNSRLTLFTERL